MPDPHPSRIRLAPLTHVRWAMVVIGLTFSCGCQTLHPFRQSVHQKAVTLRDWTHSGLDAMQNGRLAQAKSFFSRAATQAPQDTLARVNLARADAKLGDLNEAIKHMQSAVELTPDEDSLHVELGELQLKAGDVRAAVATANRSLELNPKSAGAWALRGKTRHAQGQHDLALVDYQRSLSYAPRRGEATDEVQLRMAEAYQTLGKPTRALSTIEQLLNRYPQDRQPESALIAKAESLMNLNQFGPATDVLAVCCARPEASVEAFIRLGQSQVNNQQLADAQRTLNAAQQRHPQHPVLGQLAQALRATPSSANVAAKDVAAKEVLLR